MKFAMSLLFLAAATCLAAAEFTPEAWEAKCEAARRRPRPVIVYNDGDDLIEPLQKSGPAMVDEYLARRAAGITAPPASSLFFSMIYMVVRNPNYTPALKQFEDAGMDAVQVQLDHARKHGVEFFADYRINDVHDEKERPDKPHPLYPQFKREHPEVLFGTWDKPTPYGLWSSLDFDKPLVREHVMGELRSIAEKYDIDGLNIDFGREPSLFRTVGEGDDATQAQRDLMTAWMKEVRAMLTEIGKRRGRPLLLAVRVPDSVGYCRAVGIDLEAWLKDGVVDLLITGVNFRFNPWGYSAALAKKYDRPFYASVDYPEFRHINVTSQLTRLATATYAGRATCALAAGADGIFYFNVMGASGIKAKITPVSKLASVPKIYHFTDRYLYKPERHLKDGSRFCTMPTFHPHEPKAWSDTAPHEFVLEYSGDKFKSPGDLVYGLVEGIVTPADGLVVTSNGKEWKFVGHKITCLVYEIPEGALKEGANRVTLHLKPGAQAQLADFGVRSEPNPKRLTLAEILKTDVHKTDCIAYSAASGKLPGKEWNSTYRQGNATLVPSPEPLLHLENADRYIYQEFNFDGNRDAVIGLGNHVIIRCRVRMTRAPQPPATGFFALGVSLFDRGSFVFFSVHFRADNMMFSYSDKGTFAIDDVTKFHDYEFDVNAATGVALAKQDGRPVGKIRIMPQLNTPIRCFFGDSAGQVEGAADLAYVEFKKLD